MISKKFMLMAIFLVSLLAVSAVSANEINTTDEVAIDDGSLITAEVSEDISADSQEDVLNAKDAGTFTALQNKINAANNGSVITLENDYKYDEGFENTRIEISKPLTIDGNGHTIDALSKSRIFSVYSDDVTLKNIKFVNGNAQGAGGAIYSSGANFKVINSIFTDNIADANGGAIYSSGTNCRITNSMFENNKGWSGGAIGSEGTNCNIINSTFTNNIAVKTLTGTQIGNSWYPYYAGGYGGAIYSEGSNCNIADSIFTKNTADRKGGAVYVEGSNGNLSYSTFRDNVADESGGAIYWEADDGVISYCSYTKDFTQGNDLVCGEDVVVIEDSVKINVVDMSKYYGNSITFIATVTKDDAPVSGVNVKISANGKTQTVSTNSKGQASVNLNLPVGTHEVTTEYDGVKATSNVNVKSTITASDASGTYSNSKATATFLDTAGKALASKQVTFKIGSSSYPATTNSNGVASADIPLGVDTYTVTAVNPTTKEEKQFKLTISKASSTTALTTVQNGKSVTLTATVTPSAATGKVTFEINGKTKEASLSNGKASATFSDLSENTYTAKAIYNGDANFKVSSATASVKVDKFYSIINVGDAEGVYLDSKVSATFMDVNGKALANTKVTFKIGSKSYSATTNSNGAATADIPLGVGTYTVTAVNPTTKEEKQFKLTVTKGTSSVSLNHVLNGNSVTLTATLTPASATGSVVFNVNGIKYTRTISNGKAVLTLSDESVKEFAVTANYAGDANLNAASQASASFNIKDSIIMDDTRGSYGNSKLTATFLDENGRALANTKVTFKAGGKSFTATTNSDGVASVNVDLDAGNYTVTALNPVTNKQKNSKLVINKINSSISVSSVINDDLVEFTARLTPGYLTGEVTFAMGKLSFNKPISNGRAVLNLGGFDPGTDSISVEYAGDKNIEPSKAVYLFEVKQASWMCADDLTKTYGSSKKLTIEFLNHDVISANPQVSVLLNGKNTTLDIDSNGKASLPINLAPNRYTATVYYAGDDTFNQAFQTVNILVKKATPKLTAAKKTFKKSVKIKKYTVALKTSQNKAMKSTWVSLKVNKKTYKVKTNSKGQATFKITNLKKKGTFTAIVKYSGSKYYNAKTVKPKIIVK